MIRRNLFCLTVAGTLVAAALVGCASTVKIAQFETFAKAGNEYAQALNLLLTEAGAVIVDANSEKLLDSRELVPVSEEQFKQQDDAMRLNLGEIRLLQRDISLLADYFSALYNLAESKAPEAFASEINGTVVALNGLSKELKGGQLFKKPEAAQHFASGVGGLVVRRVQSHALKRELKDRKQTIAEILLLHESLLQAVEAQITADLEFTTDRLYEERVIAPFLDSANLTSKNQQTEWKAQRRELLRQPIMIEELASAARATKHLRQAWVKLLSQQLTAADLQAIANDLQPILASLQDLKDNGNGSNSGPK